MPLERARIGDEPHPPALEDQSDVDAMTCERALAHLADALKQASGARIERHATAFGQISVAKLQEPHHLAFAIDRKWP